VQKAAVSIPFRYAENQFPKTNTSCPKTTKTA
jgi:hypothetical protein